MRIIGVDPGLRHTGWGIIELQRGVTKYCACGTISPKTTASLAVRLRHLADELTGVIAQYQPTTAALEETFVTKNGQSTLKLGQARGAILLTLAQADLSIGEYAARLVKKSIVGSGSADKDQILMMVRQLLPGCTPNSADAADALAIALTHANHL